MHKLKKYSLLYVSLGICLLLFFTHKVNADNMGWIGANTLKVDKIVDLTSTPPSINGNIECMPDGTTCPVVTGYGMSQGGLVKLNNSNSYKSVISYIDNKAHFIALPNSSQFITYTAEPVYGLYFYFNSDFSSSVTATSSQFVVKKAPDWKLADKSGRRLAVDSSSMSVSQNGQWLLVASPNTAMLRVNLETGEVLPFGPAYNYTIGLSPAPQTAISTDGRYAAVASRDFSNFAIYDLTTCASSIPTSIFAPISCQSRDLNAILKQQISGYASAYNIRFISNDSVTAYVSYKDGSANKTAKYLLSFSTSPIHQLDYLALGDSYISGEGAYSYLPGTDTSNNGCHLSSISYPLLMGKGLNFNSYHSVACSGTRVADIIDSSTKYSGQVKGGLPRSRYIESELNLLFDQFKPGYINQLSFIPKYQPQAITVSVGGNDIGFSNILRKCVGPGSCYSTYEDRLEIVSETNRKFPVLTNAYWNIKKDTNPGTNIYAIGYPQLANSLGNCALNVHLNSAEIEFSNYLISYLNATIKAAADKAGVLYIDTQSAFDGHKLCEAKPGSVAVNGLSAGNDFPNFLNGPFGKESYHPNDFGQQLLRDYVIKYSDNLKKPMPSPNADITFPIDTNIEMLRVPKSGRSVNITSYSDDLSADTVIKSLPLQTQINGSEFLVKPGSTMRSVLNSTPRDLGSYVVDSSGNLNAQVVIPPNIDPGVHTLHFYGFDISGQPIDIYKSIYVASSSSDYDGDGILNMDEVCGSVEASGKDYDKDGVDDACDVNISTAPQGTQAQPVINNELPDSLIQSEIIPSNTGNVSIAQESLISSLSSFSKPSLINKNSVINTNPPFMQGEVLDLNIFDSEKFGTNKIVLATNNNRAVSNKSTADTNLGLPAKLVSIVLGISLFAGGIFWKVIN